MSDEPVVTIICELVADAVIGDIDPNVYDTDASFEQYKKLCAAALTDAYPDAEVEIVDAYDTWYSINGDGLHSEVNLIRDICDQVWEEQEYLLRLTIVSESIAEPDSLIRLQTLCEEYTASVGLFRWCCEQQFISKANKDGLVWMISRKCFREFSHFYISEPMNTSLWQVQFDDKGLISVEGISVSQMIYETAMADYISEQSLVLVSPGTFEFPAPLNMETCYILFTKVDGQTKVTLEIFDDVCRWEQFSDQSFAKFNSVLAGVVKDRGLVIDNQGQFENTRTICLELQVDDHNATLGNQIDSILTEIHRMVDDVKISLDNGLPWQRKYEVNESEFRDVYLKKLLELLKYEIVDRMHGPYEFGKDLIFADTTKFGVRQYLGLQAKKGDLSGSSKGDINTILTQLEDAFTVPFREKQTGEHKYISTFIIAISGEFTYHAQEKIWAHLLRQGRIGMVYLWDKHTVQNLMRKGVTGDFSEHDMASRMMPDFLS